MSPTSAAVLSSWSWDSKIVLGGVVPFLLYLRGWLVLHRTSPERFPRWRLWAFAAGLAALWLAVASPLDAFSGLLLSAHMVQHLLLLSVAPPLLLLGTPWLPLLRGLPRKFARDGVGPFLVWPALRQFAQRLTHPVSCWIIMAITLCAWHVPAPFELALRSPACHRVEHICFLGASLLFWWPVVQPFPSRPQWPLWSLPLYLLVADLLNTTLSAILTFSDHVLYQPYLQAPRLFGTTALSDQSCAGVLMWVPGSLVFLIPAALIAMQYLSATHRLVRPQMPQRATAATDAAKRLECAASRLHLARISGTSGPLPAVSANPARGDLFIELRTPEGPQTPSGVTCPSALLRLAGPPADRSPLTGFGNIIKGAVCYKQLTPSGVTRPFDLLSVPLLGPFLRAQSGRRLLQAALFIIALAVIVDGLFGPQVSSANLAGVLPWTYWRALVVIGLLAAGNFFCMACPFMFFRELGRRLGLRQHSWPRALRSKWFGIALLALFFWGYEVFSLWDKPIWTAWLIINYFILALAIDALFQGASFCKYVCPIGQFQFVASLVSPLEVKVRQPGVCASCKTHDCLRGNASHRGCELDLYLPRKSGNLDCTFCLDCVRACPHDNIGVMTVAPGMDIVRDPPRASVGRLSGRLDIAALALVFVFAAFANAAFMTAPMAAFEEDLAARLGLTSRLPVASFLLFLALVMAPAAFSMLSGYVSHAAGHVSATMRELVCRFSMCLIPLGAAMWAGHFLFHLAVGWDSGWTTVQQAASRWHLVSSPNSVVSSPLMGVGTISILQTLLLDAGLLLALYLVWRIALLYTPRLRDAFRLSAPWAGVATALYAAGVWIILQPMQMRGLSAPISLP